MCTHVRLNECETSTPRRRLPQLFVVNSWLVGGLWLGLGLVGGGLGSLAVAKLSMNEQ
jgi:hypothetical protein